MPKGYVGAKLPLEPWASMDQDPSQARIRVKEQIPGKPTFEGTYMGFDAAHLHAHLDSKTPINDLSDVYLATDGDMALSTSAFDTASEHEIASIAEEDEDESDVTGLVREATNEDVISPTSVSFSDTSFPSSPPPSADSHSHWGSASLSSYPPSLCADSSTCSEYSISEHLIDAGSRSECPSPESSTTRLPLSLLSDASLVPFPTSPNSSPQHSEVSRSPDNSMRLLNSSHSFEADFPTVADSGSHPPVNVKAEGGIEPDEDVVELHPATSSALSSPQVFESTVSPPALTYTSTFPPSSPPSSSLSAPTSPRARALSMPRSWLSRAWSKVRQSAAPGHTAGYGTGGGYGNGGGWEYGYGGSGAEAMRAAQGQGGQGSGRANGYSRGGGGGGSGMGGGGSGDGDGDGWDRRGTGMGGFSDSDSDTSESESDDESVSGKEGKGKSTSTSDDDVPLAQKIPTALRAQRTIRRQVRAEREEKRREREMRKRVASEGVEQQQYLAQGPTMHRARGQSQGERQGRERDRYETLRPTSNGNARTSGSPPRQTSGAGAQYAANMPSMAGVVQDAMARKMAAASLGEPSSSVLPSASSSSPQPRPVPGRARAQTLTGSRPQAHAQPAPVPTMPVPVAGSHAHHQTTHAHATPTPPKEASGWARAMRSLRQPAGMGSVPPSPAMPSSPPAHAGSGMATSMGHRRQVSSDERGREVLGAGAGLRPMRSFHRPSRGREAGDGQGQAQAQAQLQRSRSRAGRSSEERARTGRPSTSDGQRPPVPPLPSQPIQSRLSEQPQAQAQAQVQARTSELVPAAARQGPLTQQKIFVGDLQRFHMVEIGPATSAGEALETIQRAGALEGWMGSGGWLVFEVAQDYGMGG
jgi:hypothetical protein